MQADTKPGWLKPVLHSLGVALASASIVLVLGGLLFAYTNPAFAISAYTLIARCF